MRILVIDDEPAVLHALGLFFRFHVPEVETTLLTSPLTALERIRQGERWNAILCDMRMPELTGPEFCTLLAAIDPEEAARVILVTGGITDEEDRRFAAQHRVLEKPFQARELREALGLPVEPPDRAN